MKFIDKITKWFAGWRTKIAAFALLIVNGWDVIAPQLDLGQLFSSDKKRAIFSAVMAILIWIFRGLATQANAVADKIEEKKPE